MIRRILEFLKSAFKIVLLFIVVFSFIVMSIGTTACVLFLLWNDGIRHAFMLPYLTLRQMITIVICMTSLVFIQKSVMNIVNKLTSKKL